MSLDAIYERAPDVQWKTYQKGIVTESGIALNQTGASLFQKLDGVTPAGEICRSIAAEHRGDPDAIYRDLGAFLDELVSEGLVRPVAAD